MERYFILGIRGSGVLFEKQLCRINENLFLNKEDGTKYRKRHLYDFFDGQEIGFERLPALSFEELIKIIEIGHQTRNRKRLHKIRKEDNEYNSISHDNYYGAAAVIMEDHIVEFIDFLAVKIETDYFLDPMIKKNYLVFVFDTEAEYMRTGALPGGIGFGENRKSYEQILNEYPKWRQISAEVKAKVYR